MKITRSQLKRLIAEELTRTTLSETGIPDASVMGWTVSFSEHGSWEQVIHLSPPNNESESFRFNNITELVAHITQAESAHSADGTPGFLIYRWGRLDNDPVTSELMIQQLEKHRQSLKALTA